MYTNLRKPHRLLGAVLLCAVATAPVRADFQVSPDDANSHSYPAACRVPDGFVAAWETSLDGDRQISLQRLDAEGRPVGSTSRADQNESGDAQLPDIACRADGSFMVVWESRGQDGDGLAIYARNFDASGSATGNEFQVNTYTTDNQRSPRICITPDQNASVVWNSFEQDGHSGGIYVRVFDADAIATDTEMRVNEDRGLDQSDPSIACGPSGERLVTWTQREPPGRSLGFGRVLWPDGTSIPPRNFGFGSSEESGTQTAAAIKPNGEFIVAVVNSDSSIALATVSIEQSGGASSLVRRLPTEGRNEAPVITSNQRNEVTIAWSHGSGFDFDVQAFRRGVGSAAEDRFSDVNAVRTGNDGALSTLGRGVAIAAADDGELLLWQKRDVFADDSTSAIFGRRFRDCAGDCSGDFRVSINELIQAVRIALGQAALEGCARIDSNGNGNVEINELIRAVGEALASICPAPVD